VARRGLAGRGRGGGRAGGGAGAVERHRAVRRAPALDPRRRRGRGARGRPAAPPAERPALALANSFREHRGRVTDALDPATGLHPLREAIRALFTVAAAGGTPHAADVALLNRLARAPCLRWDGAGPRLDDEDPPAEAARTAIELLAGGRIRTCGNPRCVLFYLAQGRRRYCSEACANRTRVARHSGRPRAHRRS
jgi:predicted RNA-binding Zn ribbon-like protein